MAFIITGQYFVILKIHAIEVTKKMLKNKPNPKKHAGYPKKYGQVSLNAHVPLNNLVPAKYPENKLPASDRKNVYFIYVVSFICIKNTGGMTNDAIANDQQMTKNAQ
jgi:hypothetical protein